MNGTAFVVRHRDSGGIAIVGNEWYHPRIECTDTPQRPASPPRTSPSFPTSGGNLHVHY
jgi:hypothetical protein